jgi:hypothetical protein
MAAYEDLRRDGLALDGDRLSDNRLLLLESADIKLGAYVEELESVQQVAITNGRHDPGILRVHHQAVPASEREKNTA